MRDVFNSARRLVPRPLVHQLQYLSFIATTRAMFLPIPLSTAVNATGYRRASVEERAAIERIEELRKCLLTSKEQLKVLDYGAGSSDVARTEKQMNQGVLSETDVGDVCLKASKPPVWTRLLFEIVRVYKPRACLEMGTSLGISAAYIASALKLNGRGTLVTLEGAPTLASIAARNFNKLGLDNVEVRVGPFDDTLGPTLQECGPVEFVFVDGHHDDRATRRYFDVIRAHLASGAIIIVDDINWSDGMQNAWRYITNSMAQAYDFRQLGVCISSEVG